MTRTEAQAKFDAKIASLTIDAAIECYTMLRQSVMGARGRGNAPSRDTAQAMVMTGNALEKIIGEDAMDALLDAIDGIPA